MLRTAREVRDAFRARDDEAVRVFSGMFYGPGDIVERLAFVEERARDTAGVLFWALSRLVELEENRGESGASDGAERSDAQALESAQTPVLPR